MARLVDPAFPPALAAQHDALIAAYERRLLASPTGLIETYPHEAYPTDVAAVAGAIAVHARATRVSHDAVLRHWAERVRTRQIDPSRRSSCASSPSSSSPSSSSTGSSCARCGAG